jgi:RNA polymerase sigma-70 factor (ECF subfamily)
VADDSSTSSFAALFARVQAGDQHAAAALVREYEAQIRRVIRVRLTDPHLKRQFDSVDICQSVLGDFFVRSALRQFDLKSPAQLVALLGTMARNKLLNQVERQRAMKRAIHRQEAQDAGDLALADECATPSRIVAGRELLALVHERLTSEEQRIAQWRIEGRGWGEIASELRDTPDGVRIRYSRALKRVMKSLNLDGVRDESTN